MGAGGDGTRPRRRVGSAAKQAASDGAKTQDQRLPEVRRARGARAAPGRVCHVTPDPEPLWRSFAPQARPPFTLAELRAAVPPHCFRRSLLRSSAYLAADCCAAAALYVGVRAADAQLASLAARVLLWAAYTLAQGAVCTGIWVIAHECGHGAFSDVRARGPRRARARARRGPRVAVLVSFRASRSLLTRRRWLYRSTLW